MERIKVVPMEDFVGRWIAGNDQHATTTIEIKIVDGHLVVCAIDGSSGELAEIQRLTYGNEEVPSPPNGRPAKLPHTEYYCRMDGWSSMSRFPARTISKGI